MSCSILYCPTVFTVLLKCRDSFQVQVALKVPSSEQSTVCLGFKLAWLTVFELLAIFLNSEPLTLLSLIQSRKRGKYI